MKENNIIKRYFLCNKCYNTTLVNMHLSGKAEIDIDSNITIKRNGQEIVCSCNNCNNTMKEVTKIIAENYRRLLSFCIKIHDYDIILHESNGSYELTPVLNIIITDRLTYDKFDMWFKEYCINNKFAKIDMSIDNNDGTWNICIKSNTIKCYNIISVATIISGFIHVFDSLILDIINIPGMTCRISVLK